MTNTFKLFISTIILLTASCNKIFEQDEVEFELISNAYSLPLDSTTSTSSDGLQAYETLQNTYLFSASWNTNSLLVYDTDSEKLIKKIVYNKEGADGVGNLFGFHVHNFDSIFLFPQFEPKIYLTDSSGVVNQVISYVPPKGLSIAFVHNGYFFSPPIINKESMYVKAHILGDYNEVSEDQLKGTAMIYEINFSDGEVRKSNFTYPSKYMDDGFRFFEYSMTGQHNKIVFSFFGNHNLYYSSRLEDEQLTTAPAASRFLAEELPIITKYADPKEVYKYLFAGARYESLIYEPQNKIYYRIVVPATEVSDENELKQLKRAAKRFAVQILNENLEILHEYLLEENRYLQGAIVATKRGLFLSTSHPENKELDEDYMTFDCLRRK